MTELYVVCGIFAAVAVVCFVWLLAVDRRRPE